MRKPSVLSALLLLCPLFNFPFAPAKIKDLKVHIDVIFWWIGYSCKQLMRVLWTVIYVLYESRNLRAHFFLLGLPDLIERGSSAKWGVKSTRTLCKKYVLILIFVFICQLCQVLHIIQERNVAHQIF